MVDFVISAAFLFVIGGYINLIRTVEKEIEESKKNETAEIPLNAHQN